MRQVGPSGRPSLGVTSLELQGVLMRPMKTKPASVADGMSTARSDWRISFSRTIAGRLRATTWLRQCGRIAKRLPSRVVALCSNDHNEIGGSDA
jgi:hypothetical protein